MVTTLAIIDRTLQTEVIEKELSSEKIIKITLPEFFSKLFR